MKCYDNSIVKYLLLPHHKGKACSTQVHKLGLADNMWLMIAWFSEYWLACLPYISASECTKATNSPGKQMATGPTMLILTGPSLNFVNQSIGNTSWWVKYRVSDSVTLKINIQISAFWQFKICTSTHFSSFGEQVLFVGLFICQIDS